MSHIIFTLDFHELVRGKLKKDSDCRISYDPLRIANGRKDFTHGRSDFEFIAHVQFKPDGMQDIHLTSESGVVENAAIRADGRGSMLSGNFRIPANVEEIIIWITMKDSDNIYSFDSDYGKNFHFRISEEDIIVKKAVIENIERDGIGKFSFNATTEPAVDQLQVRYRITNSKEPLREITINPEYSFVQGKKQWTIYIIVPYGSVICYDIVYFVQGNRFKIENNGNYFIAEVV